MKNILPKLSILVLCCLFVGVFGYIKLANATVPAKIDQNTAAIQEEINGLLQTNPELASSSNPYTYIQDNKHFDNIVKLGNKAIPVLINRIDNKEKKGLTAYILAIAVEKIAKVNLKENGPGWSTSQEFSQVFKNHVNNIPFLVDKIASSEQPNDQKIKQLTDLGTPAVPFIMDKVEVGNIELFAALENLLNGDNNISVDGSIKDKQEWVKQNKASFEDLRTFVNN